MSFEEVFKSWTLEKKVEWALGPNIFNLSENMRSIIVDLKAENERLERELKQMEVQDQVVFDRLRKENAKLKAENITLRSAGLKQTLEHELIIKDFIKENAKLKCLALHAMSEWLSALLWLAGTYLGKYLEPHIDVNLCTALRRKYNDAYRKAKEALIEGK